jgi:hypothetical protein
MSWGWPWRQRRSVRNRKREGTATARGEENVVSLGRRTIDDDVACRSSACARERLCIIIVNGKQDRNIFYGKQYDSCVYLTVECIRNN